jgi:hypothetical protein
MLAKCLLVLSAALFAVTGLGYLVAPSAMLSVVGIPSSATSDFLLRTEGVPLLCLAALAGAAARDASRSLTQVVLFALGAYYILGSIVDLAAFADGVVGTASVASAAGRIAIGGLCLFAGLTVRRRSEPQ